LNIFDPYSFKRGQTLIDAIGGKMAEEPRQDPYQYPHHRAIPDSSRDIPLSFEKKIIFGT